MTVLHCGEAAGATIRGSGMLKAISIAASALALGACASQPSDAGRPAGANSGVVEGSEMGAGAGQPTLGVVEGGLLGAEIGRSLSEGERRLALQAEYEALEYARPGQRTAWQSPQTGNSGEVVVGAAYEVNKLSCRELTHTVKIGGRVRVSRGTACRQPSSDWRVVGW
jgi:surface antigen